MIHTTRVFALFFLLFFNSQLVAQTVALSCTTCTSCTPLSGSNAVANASGNYCILAGTKWRGKFQNPSSSINLCIEPGGAYTGKNFGNFNQPNQLVVNSCGSIEYESSHINASQYQINVISGDFQFSGNIAGGEITISEGATWTGAKMVMQSNAKITINGNATFENFENSNHGNGSFVNFGPNSNINITDTYYPHGMSTNEGTIITQKMNTQNNGSAGTLTNSGTIEVSTQVTVVRGDYYINNGLWTSNQGFKVENGTLGGSGTYIAPVFTGLDQNNPCSDFNGSATFCDPDGGVPPEMYMANGLLFDPTTCDNFGGYSGTCNSLPIDLVSFQQYNYKSGDFHLEWQVANADGFSHFELEESENGRDWEFKEKINYDYFVDGELQNYYSSMYESLKQDTYFRLKLIDFDGAFEYSKLVLVKGADAPVIQIYPNPVKDDFINLKVGSTEEVFIQFYSVNGRLLETTELSGQEDYRLPLPNGLNDGFFFIRTIYNNEIVGALLYE